MALGEILAGDVHRRERATYPTRPQHPAGSGATKDPTWTTRTDRRRHYAETPDHTTQARSTATEKQTGGFKLSDCACVIGRNGALRCAPRRGRRGLVQVLVAMQMAQAAAVRCARVNEVTEPLAGSPEGLWRGVQAFSVRRWAPLASLRDLPSYPARPGTAARRHFRRRSGPIGRRPCQGHIRPSRTVEGPVRTTAGRPRPSVARRRTYPIRRGPQAGRPSGCDEGRRFAYLRSA